MAILDGKKISQELFKALRPRIKALGKAGVVPSLVFMLVGQHPASVAYVNMKQKACKEHGIHSEILRFPISVSEEELLKKVHDLSQIKDIGMMVYLFTIVAALGVFI